MIRHALFAVALLASAPAAEAQSGGDWTRSALPWVVGVGVSAVLDDDIRDFWQTSRSGTLDRAADVGDLLGRGKSAHALMATAYVVDRLSRPKETSHVLHVAGAYAASNVVASVLKPLVGRQRPYAEGNPARFDPLSSEGAFHSFPSGHTVHAFSLASAAAHEIRRPWAYVLFFSGATLTAWSRVYDDKHWASDVVAAAAVGTLSGRYVPKLLHEAEARGLRLGFSGQSVTVSYTPGPSR